MINKIALNRGFLDQKDYDICQKLAKELLGDYIMKDVTLDGIEKLLKRDKKTLGNKVIFVIIKKLGDTKFLPIELSSELINELDIIKNQEF